MRHRWIAVLLIAALAVATSFGIVAYRSASAASDQPSTAGDTARLGHGGGEGVRRGVNDEYLAQALGITTDELAAARQKAYQAALAQAVDSGLITQAQADEWTTNGTASLGGRWESWLGEKGVDFEALLAEALGITPEKLAAAREQAFAARLDQAVADGNLTQEQADLAKGCQALAGSEKFQSAMQSAFETAVGQAVADGTLTQAQADLILANQDNKAAHGLWGADLSSGGGDPRGHGNFDGSGRGGRWDDGTSAGPTTPPAQTDVP